MTDQLRIQPATPSLDVDNATNDGSAGEIRRRRSVCSLIVAVGAYLLLSIVIWWNIWSSHPTSTTTCGCGDSSKFTWFIAWTAHAIAHGLNPFYSTYLYHPHGINLLADTSSTAVGILLAPITWAFGPVATFNVALTLAPALSALSMFTLLRRWIAWTPAAFVGGLVYGFSPFVLVSLTSGWIDFALVAIPPLCVLCLDDLIVRRRWRPVPTGIGLGLLLTLQFFVGTEVLLTIVGFAAFGVVLLVAFGLYRRPEQVRQATSHAAVGLLSAGLTSLVLLAYPAWFALRGPASFSGPVWGGYFEGESSILRDFFLPAAAHISTSASVGYQGPYLSPQYIGIPLIVILVGGLIIWRSDLRLWLFSTIAAASALLSYLHPLGGVPLAQNIIPYRYVLVTYFAIAVLLCLLVQHTYDTVQHWEDRKQIGIDDSSRSKNGFSRWIGIAAGVGVAAVGLLPVASYEAQSIPITTQPVILPNWFRTVAPHLTPREILLVLPVQYISGESPLTWQAINDFSYKMANEGGPAGIYNTSGPYRRGAVTIGIASTGIPYFNHFTADDIAATRATIEAWGVTKVVIPDQPGLPAYDRVASVPLAAALMTAVTGQLPNREADAWVWDRVDHSPRSAIPSSRSLARCVAGSGHETPGTVERVTRCVHTALP